VKKDEEIIKPRRNEGDKVREELIIFLPSCPGTKVVYILFRLFALAKILFGSIVSVLG
jgi:hypothetical protein